MTRYYDIDEANRAIFDVERILLDLRDQREELVRLRDQVVEGQAPTGTPPAETAADTRTARLRMQFLVDQMQAGVTQLVDCDVTLREIPTGLIDFPALANGRQIWLCWRLGEGPIEWWHEMDEGFAGRRLLADLT